MSGKTEGDGQTFVRNGSNMREEGPIKDYVHSLNSGFNGYEVFVVLLSYIGVKLLFNQ